MRQTVRVALLISKQSILRRVGDLPSVISVLTKECAFLSSKTRKRRGKARSDVGCLVVLAAANLRLSGTPPRKRCHTPTPHLDHLRIAPHQLVKSQHTSRTSHKCTTTPSSTTFFQHPRSLHSGFRGFFSRQPLDTSLLTSLLRRRAAPRQPTTLVWQLIKGTCE